MNGISVAFPQLDSSIFSVRSIEGILLILFAIFIIKYTAKSAVHIVCRIIGIALLFQILYIIGNSPLDQYLHISTIFRYDVFTAIAQLCPGTFVASILTQFGFWLSSFIADTINWILCVPNPNMIA